MSVSKVLKHKWVLLFAAVMLLVTLPTFFYLKLNQQKKTAQTPVISENKSSQEAFTTINSITTASTGECNAQTIACNPEFQANKAAACGAFKKQALDALMDDPACADLDRSYVESQLNEACSKGCVTPPPTNTPTPSPTTQPPTPTQTQSQTPTPPSSPSTPSPTSSSSFEIKGVKFSLPGIGLASSDNKFPIRSTRKVLATLYQSNGTKVTDTTKDFIYNSQTGLFESDLVFNSQQNASYYVTIKTDESLSKKLISDKTTSLATGDLIKDNKMDISDYNLMISCYKGLSTCATDIRRLADLNDDGVIEEKDLNILQRAFSQGKGQFIGEY